MNSATHKTYFANVLVAYPLDQEFTYSFTEDQIIKVGTIVLVPFRSKSYLGVVRNIKDKTNFDLKKIKSIKETSSYSISQKTIKFLEWIASYNLIPKGLVLKMILPKSEAYFSEDNISESNEENDITQNSIYKMQSQKDDESSWFNFLNIYNYF